MREPVSITDIASNFADYLDRVANRGERFLLMRDGRAVAEMRPVATSARLGDLPEILAALPRLGFDDAAAFEADVNRARHELCVRPRP